MLSRVLRGQQTSRAQFKVPSQANLVPQRKQVSLARRLKQARLNPVPPALVVPHRGNRAHNPRLSQAQPALVVPHKDRQLQDRQLRQPPQHRPQQLQPQCLPPIYCCKPPWPQPSLVFLVQS